MAKDIEVEVKCIDSYKSTLVPRLNTSITETQYLKDQFCIDIVKLKRRKTRLAEDVVSLVVESSALYLRTERNIKFKKPLMMHERDLLGGLGESSKGFHGSTTASSSWVMPGGTTGPTTFAYQD